MNLRESTCGIREICSKKGIHGVVVPGLVIREGITIGFKITAVGFLALRHAFFTHATSPGAVLGLRGQKPSTWVLEMKGESWEMREG